MKELIGYLHTDLRRAFVSPIFPLAAIGMTVLLLFSIEPELEMGEHVAYLYMMTRAQGFSQAAYILGALPFGASFCLDWNYQYLKPLLIRANIARYTVSKVIVCFVSGFCTIALGQALFILALSFKFPLADPHSLTFENLSLTSHYGAFLQQGHSILYFVFPVAALSLGAAFFALVALLVSTRIQNMFVVLTSPIIVFALLQILFGFLDLPPWSNPLYILTGRFDVMSTLWASVIYQTSVVCLLSGGIGIFIGFFIKRKVAHD